jgi:hypothetical protein
LTPREIGVALTAESLVLLTAIGLFVRGRWRACVLFSIYVPVVLICGVLTTFLPAVFWTGQFWVRKHFAYDLLIAGVALEIGWRTFRAFRGTALITRCYAAIVVVLTSVTVGPHLTAEYFSYMVQAHPQLINGTIWLFTGNMVLAWWYRIPMRPFHLAISTSTAAYLGVFTSFLGAVRLYGFSAVEPYMRALDPVAFMLVACAWCVAVWRRDTPLVRSRERVMERLEARLSAGS